MLRDVSVEKGAELGERGVVHFGGWGAWLRDRDPSRAPSADDAKNVVPSAVRFQSADW